MKYLSVERQDQLVPPAEEVSREEVMKIDMNWNQIPQRKDEPDFDQLLTVLRCEAPSRPTLFEFILNDQLVSRVVPGPEPPDEIARVRRTIAAFYQLGYDYAAVLVPGFSFKEQVIRKKAKTVSLSEDAVIHNQQEFDAFVWPNPDAASYDIFDRVAKVIPKGMKLVLFSPDGVLENAINLLGLKDLCLMVAKEQQLAEDVFTEVGTRLIRYYEKAARHDSVGACIVNDDWAYKTSTLLSPATMRRLVFPWHRRIVDVVHAAGKPAILHSCGYFENTMENIIEDMEFDGRHSYEDSIVPVEKAYEKYHRRIALLGGIDMDFICRSRPEDVYHRSRAMLDRVAGRGGYALGTGNSVPDYMPDSNYFALLRAALDRR